MTEVIFEGPLSDAGVSELAIAILKEQEYTNVGELVGLDFTDFIAMGIKGKSAQILAQTFGRRSRSAGAGVLEERVGSPDSPVRVEVSMPKTFEQMNVQELLAHLVANPGDTEALGALRRKDAVFAAAAKTDEWVIPVECEDTKGPVSMDIEATLAYLAYLGKKGASRQRMFRSRRPISIEQVLGITETGMIHPLFEGCVIQDGLDQWGCDWSGVNRTLMRAILWARRTNHTLFPRTIDPIDAHDELTLSPMNRRWSAIWADYNFALGKEDPAAVAITLAVPKDTGDSSAARSVLGVILTAKVNLESAVREMSLGDSTVTGSDRVVTGVYDNLVASGSDMVFRDVIVLGSAVITGSDINGTVWLAPGATIRCSGSDMRLKQYRRNWQQLADQVHVVM